jgi:hypothetical protein
MRHPPGGRVGAPSPDEAVAAQRLVIVGSRGLRRIPPWLLRLAEPAAAVGARARLHAAAQDAQV